MHPERGVHRCDHCGRDFPRPHLRGRKPHYCSRTCRQRSYEARRRLQLRVGRPVTDLEPPRPAVHRRPRYELAASRGHAHFLRTEGIPDPLRRRPTLCGTYGTPLGPHATGSAMRACGTCRRVADRHPPTRIPDLSSEVAVLRSLVARLRHPDEDERSIVDQLLGYCFPV